MFTGAFKDSAVPFSNAFDNEVSPSVLLGDSSGGSLFPFCQDSFHLTLANSAAEFLQRFIEHADVDVLDALEIMSPFVERARDNATDVDYRGV
jgi:hypothetical protein